MYRELIPAYGRDYTTAKACLADWKSGKDFIVQCIADPYDGKPANCESFPAGTPVTLRYHRKMKTCAAKAQKIDPTAKPPKARPKVRNRRRDLLDTVLARLGDPAFDGDIIDLL